MQKNPYIIAAAVLVLILAIGVLMYFQQNEQSGARDENVNEIVALAPQKIPTVTYTDEGYAANFLSVRAGTAVTFKNESARGMWTASARHPAHDEYPVLGGCNGSAFDECREDPPGSNWQFIFEIAGVWKYHNHLKPQHTGTIIVE